MDITPVIQESRQVITGYGSGGFKINGEFIHGSLLVFPDCVIKLDTDHDITADHIAYVVSRDDIELLLIGTGKKMRPIQPAIRSALRAKNIACDAMDTGAACRTYNVLQSEERRVAVLAIAI